MAHNVKSAPGTAESIPMKGATARKRMGEVRHSAPAPVDRVSGSVMSAPAPKGMTALNTRK